jgi:hypothetical protein
MRDELHPVLSSAEIDAIGTSAIEAGSSAHEDDAWQALRPLIRVQRHQPEAARCLAAIVDQRCLSIERGLEVLAEVAQAYPEIAASSYRRLVEIGPQDSTERYGARSPRPTRPCNRRAHERSVGPDDLLAQLDRAIATRTGCSLYAPDLCEAAGLRDRATVERRRFALLKDNTAP